MPLNVLHISTDFNLVSGVTRYVNHLLKLFKDDNGYKLHLIVNKGDALDSIRDLGCNVKVIPFNVGYKGILNLFSTVNLVKKYCLKNNIDIIHTHHRYPELIALQVSKKNKIKTITTAHSIVSGFKTLSFQSDKIIAVSNYVASFLKEKYNVKEEKIIVLHNCILNESDNKAVPVSQKQSGKKDSKVILLYAGRFSKDKGTDILLEAFGLLKEKYDLELWLLGMNHDLKINSEVNEPIKIYSPVIDIEKIYSEADIFILPSRVDSFPYFMLEAGLFQKPFIGSRTGGIAEFIEDGKDGFLVNTEDPNDLKEKVEFVINNMSLAKKTAEMLHQKVAKNCNCEKYLFSLKNIYSRLLNI